MTAAIIVIVVVVVVIGGTLVGRRRGYNVGGDVVVRCRDGHLFTTVWMAGVSFKAIRLGWVRIQRCPVGDHWTFVAPVPDQDLTDSERLMASQWRDGPMP